MSWYERRHWGGLRKAYHKPKDNLGFDWLIIPLLSFLSLLLRFLRCGPRLQRGQEGRQVLNFNHPPETLGCLVRFHFNLVALFHFDREIGSVAFCSPSP